MPTQCRSVTVDDSTELDIAAVSSIYGHWARHGLGSFELEPPADRTRPAYRYACEDSIYVAPQAVGMGVGRLLLGALIERCERRGSRVMIAVIGDGANPASIHLHLAFGFERVGSLPAVGWKHARWVDSVLMSRPLGEGSRAAP